MAHPTEDKNFRLPGTARPRRYAATVTLDFDQKTFQGEEKVELTLEQGGRELVVHAVELDLQKARVTAQGRTWDASSTRLSPVSGTAVLEFQEPLPKGEAVLEVTWSGKFSGGLRGLYFAGGVAATQF